MIGLDKVGTLLSNHVHCVLDAAVRDDREDRSINDTKALDSVYLELVVNNALLDVPRETGSATGI
jgi:hypothetical protein